MYIQTLNSPTHNNIHFLKADGNFVLCCCWGIHVYLLNFLLTFSFLLSSVSTFINKNYIYMNII